MDGQLSGCDPKHLGRAFEEVWMGAINLSPQLRCAMSRQHQITSEMQRNNDAFKKKLEERPVAAFHSRQV